MTATFRPGDETIVHRLAVGVEPFDLLTERAAIGPFELTSEEVARPHRVPAPTGRGRLDATIGLPRITGRRGRHPVLYRRHMRAVAQARIVDPADRYLPRRLAVPLVSVAQGTPVESLAVRRLDGTDDLPDGPFRIRRPYLFPAASYPVSPGAASVRGRIVRDGEPLRWARLVASFTDADATEFARAQTDERGEFLLVGRPSKHATEDEGLGGTLQLTAWSWTTPPPPDPLTGGTDDPLWDLPVEWLAAPPPPTNAPDPPGPAVPVPDLVATGRTLPPAYTASDTWPMSFALGRTTTLGTLTFA